jgi:L-threonylcarbamoyladenylate synthase
MVLDGGACDVGIESTIVDCRDPRGFRVLRPGKITPSEIERALGKPPLVTEAARKVRVSGDLESHYAPRAEVMTVEQDQLMAWVRGHASETVRTLVVGRVTLKDPLPLVEAIPAPADPEEYARALYALLRSADEGGFDRVVFELPEASEIGMAIRDRLRRASAR